MEYEVSNISLSLDAGLDEALAHKEIARALSIKAKDIQNAKLLKRSVDARKKSNVHFVATYAVKLAKSVNVTPVKGVNVKPYVPLPPLEIPNVHDAFNQRNEPQPIVVGTGPAGLFAGLYLARAGMRPLVIERGAPVEERMEVVDAFNAGGPLNTVTNIQFGEGGAGTFSDGKLNTGTKSPHIRHVLQAFVDAGAPEEILWQAKPHVGTDLLVNVVRNIRNSIIEAGGEVRFYTQFVGAEFNEQGQLARVQLQNTQTGELTAVQARRLVLACGHSARDTFELMCSTGAHMERKPFAVGVRIEHPQALINRAQYGEAAEHPALGAADYKLAVHTREGRGVYTFCMCPGGVVCAAASEEGGVCVNGMSYHARAGRNANSALLVSVEPQDLPGDDVLEGVRLQREIERAAYDAGMMRADAVDSVRDAQSKAVGTVDNYCPTGSKQSVSINSGSRFSSYTAPVQTVGDFLAGMRGNASVLVEPTYPRGVAWVDLRDCLPAFVTDAMEEALPLLDRKLHGFAHPQAVMTGVEARSSSPVRIVRGENFQASFTPKKGNSSKSECGIYPCGEGAGYAGGIMSAAVDGLRVAESIVQEILSDPDSSIASATISATKTTSSAVSATPSAISANLFASEAAPTTTGCM